MIKKIIHNVIRANENNFIFFRDKIISHDTFHKSHLLFVLTENIFYKKILFIYIILIQMKYFYSTFIIHH